MFQKLGALLLAAALLVTMSACSGGKSIRGSVTPAEKDTAAAQTTATETTVPETTEPAFAVGSSAGNRYENTFLGIGCKLDENWTFLSDEQIRENNAAAAGMMADEYQKQVQDADVVYDMMANHQNEVDTLSLNMEKLSGAAKLVTEEQYAQLSLEGEYSGVKVYESLVCYKRGGYMALACACTWMEDGTQAILDCFYAL